MLNQQKKSQRNFKLTPLSIAICAAVLSPTALFAQDQTETAQETEDNILEIIEVSARKKVESIQDIPMSVTAVPAKLIRDMGLNDLKEISKYVPGLERPNSVLQSRMAIRGVSSGDNWSFEQAVGTYVDGVYRGRMNQLRAGFFDMERIEVLKGPQVTLYGNSSIGGAISMISKAPTNALEGEINLRYETQYQETDFTGALNVPITDDFAIRLAGKIRKDGKGLSINQATGEDEPKSDDSAFRISSRWNINDNWTANLKMEQSTTRVDGNFLDVFKHVNGDGTPFEPSPYTGVGDNELNVTNGDFFKPDGTFWENKSNDVSLQIDYTNDAFSFVSITAMSEYDYTQSADIDVTPLPIANTFNNEAYEQFSQEFRIANELNESTDYILGVYYQNDEIDHDYYADFNVPLILAASTGLPLGTLSNLISPFSRHLSLVQDTSQWAIFANIDHEFSDHWEGSFGLRYLNMDKTADQAAMTANIAQQDTLGEVRDFGWLVGAPQGVVLAPEHVIAYQLVNPSAVLHDFEDLKRSESHVMMQASIKYQFDSSAMGYGSWSNGAKGGGFDLQYEGGDPLEAEFEDESASVFEVGFKKSWSNARFNIAAFYGEYKDLQVATFNGSIGFIVDNAASSIQQGIDAELTWALSDSLNLIANFEILDFSYDEYSDAKCSITEELLTGNTICDWSGRPAPYVPKFKSLIALDHSVEVWDDFELSSTINVSYKGSHFVSSDLEPQTKQDAYALVDFRTQLSNIGGDWSIALSAANLFDQDFELFTSQIPLGRGGAFATALRKGRQVAIDFNYQF